MTTDNERGMILGMIESGKITAEEGLGLLKALSPAQDQYPEEENALPSSAEAGEEAAGAGTGTPHPTPPVAAGWRGWWQYPLWAGVIITVLGALLLYWAQQAYGLGLLFLCAWLPFLVGILLIALAWQSRTQRWVHLRVDQRPGDWPPRIAISLPVAPLAWFVRTFKTWIPSLQEPAVDEILRALEENTSQENPLFIEVDEGEHGERVQIFIG